ncbi:MAG TPA: hypothetical protein VHF05_03355 [Candidatus Paceibacterota bacterium]|nr:hypothetical protein [Candidatus Paceibacterota bacterium]
MKIEWNRVNWYSMSAAVVLFLAVLATGFYMGRIYEQLKTASMLQSIVDGEQNMMYVSHAPEDASTTTYIPVR